MFSVPNFLDRAKAGAGVETDYALAVKVLGHKNQSRVSNWRHEKNFPDDEAALMLCQLSGDDPEHVLACLHSMGAANDSVAGFWRGVAERVKSGGQNVLILGAVAMTFAAGYHAPADATALPSLDTSGCLYIMSNAILLWLWRTGRLACMAHKTGKALTCNTGVTS